MPNQYARLVVPQAMGSPHTGSSYLRLGTYVADESSLLPNLTTTTSSVSSTSPGAEANAATSSSGSSNQTDKYKTTPSAAISSSNNGILVFSDSDLNENIAGAVLQKYGKGHNAEVTTADAKYNVVAGKYDLSAANGIFVNAGTQAAPANLELTAGGYIKQTAYGPLDETTYGVTRKIFRGDAYDEFYGFKEAIFHGREHLYKMSGTLSMTLSGSCVLKFGTEFTLTGGVDLGIRLAADLKIFIGGKFDMVLIYDCKIVLGFAHKFVAGWDYKCTTSDMKTVFGSDIKVVAGYDGKIVDVNMTICNIKVEKEFANTAGNMCEARKGIIKSRLDNLVLNQETANISLSSLRNFV